MKDILGNILAIILLLGILYLIFRFLIWFILICIIISLIIFLFVGEDGYKHTCKHADTCPGSIRCANERKMKCYEPKDQ